MHVFQLGTGSTDYPEHADTQETTVQAGDVVLLATDGVWDNIWDDEVLSLLQAWANAGGGNLGDSHTFRGQRAQLTTMPCSATAGKAGLLWLSRGLAIASHHFATDRTRRSPFSVHAGGRYQGGKMDDITVLVALVQSDAARSRQSKL